MKHELGSFSFCRIGIDLEGPKTDSKDFFPSFSSRANMKFYCRLQPTSTRSTELQRLRTKTDLTALRRQPRSCGPSQSSHSSATTTPKTTRELPSTSSLIKCSKEVSITTSTCRTRKLFRVLITLNMYQNPFLIHFAPSKLVKTLQFCNFLNLSQLSS